MPEIGTTLTRGFTEINEVTEGQPNSGVWKQTTMGGFKRGDWDCRSVMAYELTSTAKTFVIKESVKLMKGEEVFFEQETLSTIEAQAGLMRLIAWRHRNIALPGTRVPLTMKAD